MEMNDVDNIINDMVGTPNEETTSPQESTPADSSFSDEDIDEILEENNIPRPIDDEEEESDDGEYNAAIAHATAVFQEALDAEVARRQEQTEEECNDSSIPKIPTNSPTLLVDETTSRFSGAEWFKEIQKTRVIIAGIGGIGSNVAFQLARMSPASMILYDPDMVEMVNMAGQLYSYEDIGKFKVDALAGMISSYTSTRQVNAVGEMFSIDTEPGDIMICGFDNMRARKTFFNSWMNHINEKTEEEKAKCLYLDGRLSMDTLQILCIRGDDTYNIGRYQHEFLFSDFQADETVCSMKQTTYLACMIGSLMVNLYTNFVAGTLNPAIPYDLPFFTEYNAQSMIFKTES